MTIKKAYERLKDLQKGGPEFKPLNDFDNMSKEGVNIFSNKELEYIMRNNLDSLKYREHSTFYFPIKNLIKYCGYEVSWHTSEKIVTVIETDTEPCDVYTESWNVIEIRKGLYLIITDTGHITLANEEYFKNSNLVFIYANNVIDLSIKYPRFKLGIYYFMAKIVDSIFVLDDNYVLSEEEMGYVIDKFNKKLKFFKTLINDASVFKAIDKVIKNYIDS